MITYKDVKRIGILFTGQRACKNTTKIIGDIVIENWKKTNAYALVQLFGLNLMVETDGSVSQL